MTPATTGLGRQMLVSNWRPYEKNTMRGFLTLTLPSGLIIHGCTLHQKADSRWIGLPAQKVAKADGNISYVPILEFASKESKDRFMLAALAAVDLAALEVSR